MIDKQNIIIGLRVVIIIMYIIFIYMIYNYNKVAYQCYNCTYELQKCRRLMQNFTVPNFTVSGKIETIILNQ